MNLFRKWRLCLNAGKANPALAQAQMQSFSKQMPLMYVIVIIDTIALAYVHYPFAPKLLSLYLPAGLVALSIIRMITYWSFGRNPLSDDQAKSRLRQMTVLAAVLGGIFSTWTLTLYAYGNAYTQVQILLITGVTCFGMIVCLMPLWNSALVLVISTIGVVSTYMLVSGKTEFMTVSINLVLVACVVLVVLHRYSRDFARLVAHQQAMDTRQEETQELSDKNLRMANQDSLTDLANRRRFFSELKARIETGRARKFGLAVAVLDLDGFKPINDIYGHAAGDRVLIEVARRLSEFSEDVFATRLGGDEFGLVIENYVTDEELIEMGACICGLLQAPVNTGSTMAQMSGSLGICKFPDSADTAEKLFECADYALFHAKSLSRGHSVLFTEGHGEKIRDERSIDRRLQDADLENELSVAFQFVVDDSIDKIVGAEALARWTNPVLGWVSPAAFIPAAERSGSINRLTEIMFRKTIEAVALWPDDLFISFNLSPHDIAVPEHIRHLASLVEQSGIAPHRFTFEITESSFMHDFQRALESLQILKNLGCKIALDDFGTGFSSLSHVRNLPLDRLKVDRSFVNDIESDQASRAVARTIIDLCRNLKLDCIVEGVETVEQLQILKEIGCTKIQGYLFSRPMEVATAMQYVKDNADIRQIA
ncbi:MAG: EAL domain-containing protein [Rhizobiaceae bacterium]|nr:EAL domain-containing protein [Rhizobiaceae bacterium]